MHPIWLASSARPFGLNYPNNSAFCETASSFGFHIYVLETSRTR